MSTIKESPGPRINPYLEYLYGLFNLILLALMVLTFVSVQGGFSKSAAASSSNATMSPSSPAPDVVLSQLSNNYLPVELSSDMSGTASPCSMGACFDYSRCDNMDEIRMYHYGEEHSLPWSFKEALMRSPYYTTDPAKACLFLVTVDKRVEDAPPLSSLPFWNNGLNHVVISIADRSRNSRAEETEMASTMTSSTHQSAYRPGFDLSVPLPQKNFYTGLQEVKARDRKYFLTFKGKQYSHYSPVLREMHNGEDIIVATTCKQASNSEMRLRQRVNCVQDESIFNQFNSDSLMNSAFGLVPAGRGPTSPRLLEVLSAGSIPVVISDNFVLPFDTLIEWRRCVSVFPTSQMHRVVPTLRSLSTEEIEFRRDNCLFIYQSFFENDDKIVATTAMALKSRFFGVLPKLIPEVPLPPLHLR